MSSPSTAVTAAIAVLMGAATVLTLAHPPAAILLAVAVIIADVHRSCFDGTQTPTYEETNR